MCACLWLNVAVLQACILKAIHTTFVAIPLTGNICHCAYSNLQTLILILPGVYGL